MQIMPVGNYPSLAKKFNNSKLVVINLQETRVDSIADLIINEKLDTVFRILFKMLFNNKEETKPTVEIILNRPKIDDEKKDKQFLIDIKNVFITEPVKQLNIIEPHIILLLSGKRKCGKDFICQKLVNTLESDFNNIIISKITIASPIKRIYANKHNIDYQKLLDTSPYKEIYRADMMKWSQEVRDENPDFFCKEATFEATKDLVRVENGIYIWIVTDLRRQTDLEYFGKRFGDNKLKTVRITANEQVRTERGWIFTRNVDDNKSECDLDWRDSKNEWDFTIKNNVNDEMEKDFQNVIEHLKLELHIESKSHQQQNKKMKLDI
jgi:phosphomevalonate kinase